MAANGVNTSEDAEMTTCDGDAVVTMMDVLQEQQYFENDANAVLGASDDKNCTYSKGYVKRQALYACLTCCPEAKDDPSKRAGFCLACSLNCHENHELIELYTKRNFRCDCGNPKFNGHPCTFTPNKNDLNYENKYNQNFSGIYCVCRRPYPDPEAVEEQEMLQCIVCEDWLHTKHLEATVPHTDQYEEMVCKDCMEEYDFLHDYSDLVVNIVDKEVVVDEFDFDFDLKSSKKGKSKKTVTNGKVDDTSEKLDAKTDNEKKNEEPPPEKVEGTGDETNAESNGDKDSKMDTSEVEIKETTDDKSDQSDASKPEEDSKPDETINGEPKTESQSDSIISKENNSDSIETKENSESVAEEKKTDEESPEKAVANENIADKDKQPEKTENQEVTDDQEQKKIDQEQMEEDKLLQDDVENKDVTDQNPELPDSTKNEEETKKETELNETTTSDAEQTENTKTEEKKDDEVAETDPDTTKNDEASTATAAPDAAESADNKRKLNGDDGELAAKKPKLEGKPCIRPRGVKRVYKGATFWPSNLRQKLCTCNECISMYKDLAVLFLTDPDDTVNAYEALGKEISEGPSSQYEKGLQALSSLDRVQQINALTEYNKMRDKLLDFLKGYKDRKEIVKEEDIKSFFAGMKPKREPDGVYFCR